MLHIHSLYGAQGDHYSDVRVANCLESTEIQNKPQLQLLKLLQGIHNMWINDHKSSLFIFYISCLTHLLDPDDKNYQGSWRKMLKQYPQDNDNDNTELKTNPLFDPDSDKPVSCTLYLCIFANRFVSMIL